MHLKPEWRGLAERTSLRLERRDANCTRREYEGTFDLEPGTVVAIMRTYGDSFACSVERSWATWTATLIAPNGSTRWTVLEVAQISSVGASPMRLELKCYGGNLSCERDEDEAPTWLQVVLETSFSPA